MKNNDMLIGKPIKTIILFALPIMGSALLQYAYNFVDNIIVGRFISSEALAGVGNVSSINSLIIGAALGLTGGFTIPIAQKFGAGDIKKMNAYAGNSISLSLIIGVVIVIIARIISYPILKIINTPSDIIKLSSDYVNILYLGIPIQLLFNNFTAIARAVGESKKPMAFLSVSVVVNFILDILFVAVFKMGVKGAATATIISYLVAAVLAGLFVFKKLKIVQITKDTLKLNKFIVGKQIKLGVPLMLQFTITSIGSMALQSAVNSFGSGVVAAFTAAGKVEQITNIPMSGLGVGTATFVAQNFGAENYDRILKSVRKILFLDIIVSFISSAILIFIGPHVVNLFIVDMSAEVFSAAKKYLYAIAECYILLSFLFVYRNTLQGLGFTYANTIAGAGELFGRLAVAYIFTPIIGFNAVCYAGPCAWLLADIPLLVIYFKKRKKFKQLSEQQKRG